MLGPGGPVLRAGSIVQSTFSDPGLDLFNDTGRQLGLVLGHREIAVLMADRSQQTPAVGNIFHIAVPFQGYVPKVAGLVVADIAVGLQYRQNSTAICYVGHIASGVEIEFLLHVIIAGRQGQKRS